MRVAAVAAAVFATGGGGAFAYFRASGDGSSHASAQSPAPLVITASIPTTGLLYPGGSGEVDGTISNPNPFAVRVNSLVLDTSRGDATGFAVDSDHGGCDVRALSFDTQTNGGTGWTVPSHTNAGDGTLELRLSNAARMDVAAASACQGASFTVYLATGP